MTHRLGKTPAIFDTRTLRFGDYLSPQLPPPPASTNHGAKVSHWPLYDNDRCGSSTCAAAAHLIQSWTASAGAEVIPPLSAVLAFYQDQVGALAPPEATCSMIKVLKSWQHRGLSGNKILAFTQIEPNNHSQVQDAIYLFGGAYIGVALPDFVLDDDLLTSAWTLPPQRTLGRAAPNPHNGHCVVAVGYDARSVYVVTWGAMKSMSWPFYDTYVDEAYAVLNSDWIEVNGATVAGFNLAALRRDLRAIQTVPSIVPALTHRHEIEA